jgi:hypothetical protein
VRAGLKKELGHVDERRGRSPRHGRGRGSAAVEGKTELTWLAHRAARESERADERFADGRGPRDRERVQGVHEGS